MDNLKDFKAFESMLHKKTMDQLKKVSKEMDGIDVGQRVDDSSFANALQDTKRDVTQHHIQTYDEYLNEPFSSNQNRKPWDERSSREKNYKTK